MPAENSSLPYTDTKPVGAAGFYTAINSTFRFIHDRLGMDGLLRYWQDIGTKYYSAVSKRWATAGLNAIADHWRAFFAAEPGAAVEIKSDASSVTIEVKTCPMIQHLRDHKRDIIPCFCQHCYYVSEAIARPAGFTVRVSGGNGACVQIFHQAGATAPQDINAIQAC